MRCQAVCANDVDNECTRQKRNLLQAECADRVIYIKCNGKLYISRKWKSDYISRSDKDVERKSSNFKI